MHVVKILRDYLGISQAELARRAGITQPDLSEIESIKPYGLITKYQRLANALGVTVHAIAMNDPSSIPLTFFDSANKAPYTDPLSMDHTLLGRQGEEKALQIEQERLMLESPALAKLVLPYFKMKIPSPGFDILSYGTNGKPIFIEVKTTDNNDAQYFQLTKHEYEVAKELTKIGKTYLIYHFTAWSTDEQKLNIIDFAQMESEKRITPAKYVCNLREDPETVTGIVYFRKKLGISQAELASRTGIPATSLCHYEQGERQIAVDACIKLSNFYQVTIDDILRQYPSACYNE